MDTWSMRLVMAVVAALVVSAITALIRKRRLYLLAPRLFSFSGLSDRGAVVEITLFNRGIYSEEQVEVSLNAACRYDLVASTSRDVFLANGKISLPRMPPEEEVTIIFLAEGKEFSTADIQSISSKAVRGHIAKRLEDLLPSTRKLGLSGLWAALAATAFVAGMIGVGNYFDRQAKQELAKLGSTAPTTTLASEDAPAYWKARGWNVSARYFGTALAETTGRTRLPVVVVGLKRTGDQVRVALRADNRSETLFRVDAKVISPAVEPGQFDPDSWINDVFVFPGSQKEFSLKARLPATAPQQILVVDFDIFFESNLFSFERTLEVSPETP